MLKSPAKSPNRLAPIKWESSDSEEDEEDPRETEEEPGARINPFLNDSPGFAPFQLYGRRKRGRPSLLGRLLPVPVAEQEGENEKAKKPRPASGPEVKRYLDDLRDSALLADGKNKRRNFGCPRNRDFEPFPETEEFEEGVGIFADEDQFRPRLFDYVRHHGYVLAEDEDDLPKRKIGRPRIHPAKEKIPGRKRGRPKKNNPEGQTEPKEKRPKGRPRIHPKTERSPKPRMIFTFERTEEKEKEIEAMIASGMVVVSSTEQFVQLMQDPKKLGRPRIRPPKLKVPGRMRGRPRVRPPKEKIPGRKRGRPTKPRMEEPPREKGQRGRPKVIFAFKDLYDLSPEEIRKLQMEGVRIQDLKKKSPRRIKTQDGVMKKRGRPRKVVFEGEMAMEKKPRVPTPIGAVEGQVGIMKKRGRKKKIKEEGYHTPLVVKLKTGKKRADRTGPNGVVGAGEMDFSMFSHFLSSFGLGGVEEVDVKPFISTF